MFILFVEEDERTMLNELDIEIDQAELCLEHEQQELKLEIEPIEDEE